jgi:hypothetical protein
MLVKSKPAKFCASMRDNISERAIMAVGQDYFAGSIRRMTSTVNQAKAIAPTRPMALPTRATVALSSRIATASAASARPWQTAWSLSDGAPASSETIAGPPLAGSVTNIEARKGMMR